jgi:SAM-dependent methyltransferase
MGHIYRCGVSLLSAALAGCGPSRQPGVIYLPSTETVVDRMLALARVGPDDIVYDLGCGDGRIVIAAARDRGARGLCNDIDPARIAESRRNAEAAGVADRIRLDEGDLFDLDLREATVVALYLSPALNLRLRPKLYRELRPGARVVSHNFDMADWRPDSSVRLSWPTGGTSAVYLWTLPADVAGTWEVILPGAGEEGQLLLRLAQEFQRTSGTASRGGRAVIVSRVRLVGDSIALALDDTLRLRGRVIRGTMEGVVEGAAERRRWSARRPY